MDKHLLEGIKFPNNTIEVVKRGEALANFEREFVIHFQRISKATALYAKALLGGEGRALEIYGRVGTITKGYDWAPPTAEETWHNHAETWQSAKLLRAIPTFRTVIMATCDYVSPALGTEESSLMDYLQRNLEARPTVG